MATQIESVSPQTAPRGAGTQPARHEAAGRGVLERFSYDDAIVRWFMGASVLWGIVAMLVGVVVVVHYRKQLPAAALFFVLMLGQYGVTAWRNSGFDINQYVRVMRQMVPAGSAPIVAEYNAWFSFYDRQFYGSYKYDDAFYYDREEFNALGLAQFTLVDRLDAPQGSSVGWREQVMPQGYGCEPRAYFSIQGRDYGAYSCARVATP